MASSTSALGAGTARSGKTSPGSTPSSSFRPSSSVKTSPKNRLSASEIMKAKKPSAPVNVDPYPGLDAILKKSRKLKPFSDTDREQRLRALRELAPSGVLPAGIATLAERMERDYARAVSDWRANNWLLPVDKESEFPYSRTRNIGDAANPDFKYGSAWLPRPDTDSGVNYDSEGERIPHSVEMENIERAAIMRESDLRIKGIEERDPVLYEKMAGEYADMLKQWNLSNLKNAFKPRPADDKVLLKMKSENPTIRKTYNSTKFNRYDEMWATYTSDGYTISPRFRAFKLFSKEQQKLKDIYESTPTPENKKTLLEHVKNHGELVVNLPTPDPTPKKEAPKPEPKPSKKGVKTIVGNATDLPTASDASE